MSNTSDPDSVKILPSSLSLMADPVLEAVRREVQNVYALHQAEERLKRVEFLRGQRRKFREWLAEIERELQSLNAR